MTKPQRRPRTLLVGPIGARPWISRNELVAQLDDLGHEVLINGVDGADLVAMPEPMRVAMGRLRNSLPSLFAWYVQMAWRWWRTSNRRLRAAGIDFILVWDPMLAGLARVARPRGVQVIWVAPRSDGVSIYHRLLRVLLSMSADRVVVSWDGDARWVRSPVTLTRPPLPVTQTPRIDEWVLFATLRAPTQEACELLAARAAISPARAVVFDSRDRDRVAPQLIAQLRSLSGAQHVWWGADDEWVEWLGGVPDEAVEISDTFVADHRHLRVLGAGGSVLIPASTPDAAWSQVLQVVKTHDGWAQLAVRDDVSLPPDEAAWSTAVFAPPAPTSRDLIAEHGRAVDQCPICGSDARRVMASTSGATRALRCAACGATYASHVLPAEVLNDPEYHTGGAAFGADYQSDVIRELVEEVADLRLDVLDELGVAKGRLLDVGAGLGHMVHRAKERGWDAEGIDVVAAAADAARRLYGVTVHTGTVDSVGAIGRFDVVSFGQTIEHLPDPVGTLRFVREHLLAPGGRVFIEAPNVRSVARVLQRRRWMHWQPGDHHTYPDAATMRTVFERAGYETEVVRSDSLTVRNASELVLAYNLGLVSDRTTQLFPPTTRWLVKAKTYKPLRRLTQFVDARGLGQNIVAVGRAR